MFDRFEQLPNVSTRSRSGVVGKEVPAKPIDDFARPVAVVLAHRVTLNAVDLSEEHVEVREGLVPEGHLMGMGCVLQRV